MKHFICVVSLCLLLWNHLLGEMQIRPALCIEPIEITDASAYGELLATINTQMKDRYDVPLYLRSYATDSISGRMHGAFALSPSLTLEGLLKNEERFSSDLEMETIRQNLASVSRSVGPKTYLKAVRFDGTNTPGYLFNSLVAAESEDALLDYLDASLVALGDTGEMPKVNVFRVLAGDGSFTHLVSFNLGSMDAVGALLDRVAEAKWGLEFTSSEGEHCKLVQQAIYYELD